MMGQYRKRPVVIEAVRLLRMFHGVPVYDVSADIPEWLEAAMAGASGYPGSVWSACSTPESDTLDCLAIGSLEGNMLASPGDWILRGVQGELYPCKPEIFAATYEDARVSPGSVCTRQTCKLSGDPIP